MCRLSSELDMIHEKKVIVFVNTKRQCDNVYAHLEDAGNHCTVLHGGRTQEQREVRAVMQAGLSYPL
jgi:ATP-dependent RNA helicase DDX23/PRP28